MDDHYAELIESEYRPGDMAHPVDLRRIRDVIAGGIRNPDTWTTAFMLGMIAIVAGAVVLRG